MVKSDIENVIKPLEFAYFYTVSTDKFPGQNVPGRVTGTGK